MGIFDRFPYSSTHEMNLDFMLGKATEIAEDMQQVTAGMEQVQAGLTAISEKTEQATQAAAQAAASASSIEGSVTAAEEAAEEAQMHNESAQTWANNAMTYKADCQRSATEAAASSSSAAQAATAAAASEDTVATYAQAANASAQSAANNNDSAHQYANQASASASNATFHSSNAQTAATNANTSATNAETAATNAQTAATRTAALKDDCETLHRMCTAAVDQAANSAAQAAAAKTDVENLVESLPEDFTDLNAEIKETNSSILDLKNENGDKFIPDDKWESGGVNYESGALVPTSSYIRTLTINIDEYYRVTISVDNGYKYTYAFYDSTGTNCVKAAGALLTESISVDKPTGSKYIRIALGKVSGNPDLSDSSHVNVLGLRKLLFDVANISVSVSTGTGNTAYDGEKIILDDSMPQKYRCNISAWKDFFKSDIASLADYSLHLNQSLAIYGGYMFLFQDGGEVVVIDYATKTLLGKFDTPVISSNHQNGAHFSNIFYASGDEFPLLFVSRADTMPNNECLIYRVQRSGNVFSFDTVNTLNTSTPIYQGTYAVDNKRKIISCVSYLSANYGTPTNNPVMIRTWGLPTKAEILSGTPISLDINDAFVEWSLPYAAFQQCALSNGVLFVGYQPEGGGRNIYCFDALTGRFKSNVPMTDKVSEIEGVYVYDSKLFVTQKRGTDTTATNPITIYGIEF